MLLWKSSGPVSFTMLCQFFKICRYFFMNSCLKILPQGFNWVHVWHLDCFLFSNSVVFVGQALAVRPKASHMSPEYLDMQRGSLSVQWLRGAQLLWLQYKPITKPRSLVTSLLFVFFVQIELYLNLKHVVTVFLKRGGLLLVQSISNCAVMKGNI